MSTDEYSKEHGERLSKLETDVHNISSLVGKLFEKFDDFIEKMQPKRLGIPSIVGIAVSMVTMLAMLFGSMIWIVNSMIAPLSAQNSQIIASMQTINTSVLNNNAMIQLTNKEVATIKGSVGDSTETIRWMLFDRDILGDVTGIKKDILHLEKKAHLHKQMVLP